MRVRSINWSNSACVHVCSLIGIRGPPITVDDSAGTMTPLTGIAAGAAGRAAPGRAGPAGWAAGAAAAGTGCRGSTTTEPSRTLTTVALGNASTNQSVDRAAATLVAVSTSNFDG